MFDLGFDKIVLIAIVAGVLIGPKRLPAVAAALGRYVRRLRLFIDETKESVEAELGSEFSDFDWRQLDPRQYDPRRIVRDALLDIANDADPVDEGAAGDPSLVSQREITVTKPLSAARPPSRRPDRRKR